MTETNLDEICPRCTHEFNPHIVVLLYDDVQDGGIIICQNSGCECLVTWAAEGRQPPKTTEEIRNTLNGELSVTDYLDMIRHKLAAESN